MSRALASLALRQLEKQGYVLPALQAGSRFTLRAAKNDPLATAATVGGGVALGPTAVGESLKADPVMQARAAQRRLLAQQLMGKQAMKKVASVKPSADQLREGLAIRRSLEKQAASRLSRFNVANAPQMFMAGAMLSAGAAAAGGAGMGVSMAIGKGGEALHARKKDQHFNAMLKADPSMKTDPKAKAFFDVLHRASPYIASEPHVAAATVRSMLESPEGYALHPKFMQSILSIEEQRQRTRYPTLRTPPLRGELPDMD